jgi:predicted amidophosphoribosyltransferase
VTENWSDIGKWRADFWDEDNLSLSLFVYKRVAGVLLFDDVRTTGSTSLACRWRLQRDVNAGQVVRLFLARVEG